MRFPGRYEYHWQNCGAVGMGPHNRYCEQYLNQITVYWFFQGALGGPWVSLGGPWGVSGASLGGLKAGLGVAISASDCYIMYTTNCEIIVGVSLRLRSSLRHYMIGGQGSPNRYSKQNLKQMTVYW